MKDALPRIDPEYLLEECDRERLDAFSRGLLKQSRLLRAKSDKAEPRYSLVKVRAATTRLMMAYIDLGQTPPLEFAELLKVLIEPEKWTSTLPVRETSEKAYWAAIRFEAKQPADAERGNPSTASVYAVARHVREMKLFLNKSISQKTAEATIKGWRKEAHYRDNVALHRTSKPFVRSKSGN